MKHALLITFLLGWCACYAQDSYSIVTDRPTQSAASTVVPRGNFLVEYGLIREKAGEEVHMTFANIHLRAGILKGIELRYTQNVQQTKNTSANEKINGLTPATIGTKVHIIKEKGAIPQTSIIGQVTIDNGKREFRQGEAVPEVRLNFSNTLSKYWSLGYNLGVQFPESTTTTLYTAVIGYSFQPGWTVFAEPYGFFYKNDSDHRLNAGIIYLVKDHLQFDVSWGVGLSDISPDSFVGFGVAFGW